MMVARDHRLKKTRNDSPPNQVFEMTKLTGFLLGTLAIVSLASCFPNAHAATPLPPAPANGWCDDGSTATGYYGVRNCPDAPPPPPPAAGRQTIGRVAYQSAGVAVRDLTEFASVFGHATADDAVIGWPGRHNSQPTILEFVRGAYVALHFRTNALGQIPTFGFIVHTEYNYGFDPSFSISRAAGDFSSSLGVNCYAERRQSGQNILPYAMPLTGFSGSCHLAANSDYFMNIKMANPAQVTSTCAATSRTCPFGLNNNFN
jgi:hypothetical protein